MPQQDVLTPCRIWTGYVAATGYGMLKRDGRAQNTHRYFWIKERGPIPEGLVLDHLCGNRLCYNLDHLEIVTQTENVRRSSIAKISPDQVLLIKKLRKSGVRGVVIAEQFGITYRQVCAIVSGAYWK